MKEHLFDKRVVQRALQEGLLDKEVYQRMLDALPDVSHKLQAAGAGDGHSVRDNSGLSAHSASTADDDLDDDLDEEDDEDEQDDEDEADEAEVAHTDAAGADVTRSGESFGASEAEADDEVASEPYASE